MKLLPSRKLVFHLVLASLVLLSLAGLGWVLFDNVIMPKVSRQGWPETTLPSTEGMTLDEATRVLQSSGLVPVLDPVRRASDKLPPDVVAFQSPDPGEVVKKGHQIRLWLSAGPTSIRVPDLSGRGRSEATRLLGESELTVSDSVEWRETTSPYGQVIATVPKAGTILSRGANVRLVLSAGDSTLSSHDNSDNRLF